MGQNESGPSNLIGTGVKPVDISHIGVSGVGSPRFMHFETSNPEFPIALRIGPMVLVPGHKRAGLEEGCLCLSFGHSSPEASS
jgi:hypothetical protein